LKAVILAGGRGSRLAEETEARPKPMVEVGGKPILWHIMKIFSAHGVNDFVICLGYKGYLIKEYFTNYLLHSSNVTINLETNELDIHENLAEPWRVTLVDTGLESQTGGRLLRVKEHIEDEETFLFTYGDGVGNIDVTALLQFHQNHGKLATVSAVRPAGRFGTMEIDGKVVRAFREKQVAPGSYINGGFFALSSKVLGYIENDQTVWEDVPLTRMTEEGNLCAWRHDGFWQPMDTIRERQILDEYWRQGDAPWKVW